MKRLLLAGLFCLAAAPALADCDHFKWSVEKDRAALAAPKALPAVTGVADVATGYMLSLAQDVKPPVAPERAAKAGTFAAVFTLPKLDAGLYQVTLSDEAWIDVAEAGALVKSSDFSGQRDCPGVRKSVRFPLNGGATTIEISNAAADHIGIVVSPAR